jgi:TolB protein
VDIGSLGARVAFISLEGEGQEAPLVQPGAFQAPGIARTGRYWAYADMDDLDNSRLVITGPAETEPFTWPHQGAIALSWDPSASERLAFISSALPAQQFYGPLQVVDVATRSVRTLVEDTILAFFWSPNGQYLAYLTLDQMVQVDGRQSSLNRSNGIYGNGRGAGDSPQESALASSLSLKMGLVEVATGVGRHLYTFTPVPLFVNQFLPFFDQYSLSHHLWSPASDALVLPVMAEDKPQIMVLPIDGASAWPIGDGVMAFWSWQ